MTTEETTTEAMSSPFRISRLFAAPRGLVWKAWGEREHPMQWFGPKGFAMTTAGLDFRTGGLFPRLERIL